MSVTRDPAVSTGARHYIAVGYVLLIVYASLTPFTGWRDQGFTFVDVLTSPLSLTYNAADAWVNFLAYIPFGMVLALTLLPRLKARWSVLLAVLGGAVLSGAMEYLQTYLPTRTSSNLDILTNTGGALAGALLAVQIAPAAWFAALSRWRYTRIRRGPGADFGLALIALWMFVQVNPSLPMLGNIFISETVRMPFQPAPIESFNWLAVSAAALNLLMLGGLYLTLLKRRRYALTAVILTMSLVALGKFLAAALLFNSWALLLWLDGASILGIIAGLALLAVATRLSARMVSVCAAAAALAYLGEDILHGSVPSGLSRLYHHGREGHFTTYNGLSHLILMLFPLLLLGYLWHARKWSRLPV